MNIVSGEIEMKPSLNNLLGLLRIRVKRGVNLAVRDLNSSDPYVIVKMGKQVTNLYFFTIILYVKPSCRHVSGRYMK